MQYRIEGDTLDALAAKIQKRCNINTPINPSEMIQALENHSIYMNIVKFEDWHNGTSESGLVEIPHTLERMPKYVALFANVIDWQKALNEAGETPPSKMSGVIINADRMYDAANMNYLPCLYLRGELSGKINAAATSAEPLMIARFDSNKVYVNSVSTGYAWMPERLSTYTIICI